MALITCPECSTNVSDKAASCPSCGCPISKKTESLSPNVTSAVVTLNKSRGIYIILGILFGASGFHNFYSGHNLSGGVKIGFFIVTFGLDASTGFYSKFSLVALVICELWALVEIMLVRTDGAGNKMS